MASTKIVLDRQAEAKNFGFGTTAAGGGGLVTVNNGTAAATTVGLDVKGSQNIGGDLNLTGNLNITGAINETAVNNLAVTDLTIRVNKGGTTAGAAGAGLQVEGDAAALIGAITFLSTSATKFQIGNGAAQADIADISSIQTFTNKVIGGGQITGNITGSAANVTGTVAVANGGTSLATLTAGAVIIGNGAAAPTFIAPGSNGNVLTSNGTAWVSAASAAPTTSFKPTTIATGVQNGTNTAFTTTATIAAGTEHIYLNGQLLTPGPSADYTLSGTTLTFVSMIPTASDIVRIFGNF